MNGDEVRELPYCDISGGSGLPWKLATWGSVMDASLLARVQRKWERLEDCEARWKQTERAFVRNGEFGVFGVAQGPDLGDNERTGI